MQIETSLPEGMGWIAVAYPEEVGGCRSKPPSREVRGLMEEEGLGVGVLRNDHDGCRSYRRQGLSVVTPSFLETQ